VSAEHSILSHFEKEMPDKAREIRDRIYSFENIATLLNREVRILIDELNDDRLLALALNGAGDEIRFKVLRNMSNNRASDIIAEMDRMGPVRMTEILDARQRIVFIMRRLNDVGSIIIRKGDEQYVE
jgi:flagellar motor switch protein FliG